MRTRIWASLLLMALAALMIAAMPKSLNAAPNNFNSFGQVNLVSDLPGVARFMDTDLVNPWGIAFSSGSPIWVSDNGTGLATLYDGAGMKQGLVVMIPAPGGGKVRQPVRSSMAVQASIATASFLPRRTEP